MIVRTIYSYVCFDNLAFGKLFVLFAYVYQYTMRRLIEQFINRLDQNISVIIIMQHIFDYGYFVCNFVHNNSSKMLAQKLFTI